MFNNVIYTIYLIIIYVKVIQVDAIQNSGLEYKFIQIMLQNNQFMAESNVQSHFLLIRCLLIELYFIFILNIFLTK